MFVQTDVIIIELYVVRSYISHIDTAQIARVLFVRQ